MEIKQGQLVEYTGPAEVKAVDKMDDTVIAIAHRHIKKGERVWCNGLTVGPTSDSPST